MNYKVIESEYGKYYNASTVLISTPLGYFEGWAFLNPEDKDFESNFTGCEIAEARAVIQYIKAQKANLKIELKALKDLEKVFISLKDFCPKSREFCQLRKQIHIKEKKLEDLNNEENNLITFTKELPKKKMNLIKEREAAQVKREELHKERLEKLQKLQKKGGKGKLD